MVITITSLVVISGVFIFGVIALIKPKVLAVKTVPIDKKNER